MNDDNAWSLLAHYVPAYLPPVQLEKLADYIPEPETLWFFFEGEQLLLLPPGFAGTATLSGFPIGETSLPCGGRPSDWVRGVQSVHPLGIFTGHACCAVRVVPEPEPREPDVPDMEKAGAAVSAAAGLDGGADDGQCAPRWRGLRDALPEMADDAGFLAGRALQILNWERNNRFCGRCGERMMPRQDERAMRCPACGFLQYPRLSPAVIVSVLRGDTLLLVHNNRFPSGRYSLLAGFVEAGETFEDCVSREIEEEVGIRVKNIRYLSSQPWPFPDSLMVGFTAEWAAGELQPDGVEIGDARWFTREAMPEIPGPHTIAGKIIRSWMADQ